MEAQGAHARLLGALRARCAGPPQISSVTAEHPTPRIQGWIAEIDLLLPLFLAGWRCAAVRSALAVLLGLAALCAAGCLQLSSVAANGVVGVLTAAGSILVVVGAAGVPGGVPFLEVKTAAGFHCDNTGAFGVRNQRLRQVLRTWQARFTPCPYLRSGELCTLLPFMWNPNRAKNLTYERVWVEASDQERVATDWLFPPTGYNPERPVVLLLTGLAPSTHWTRSGGYIGDAAWHLSSRLGMTVVVLVARGTMDTQVEKHLFHGARVGDLRTAILMIEEALHASVRESAQSTAASPPIFAAGYSMGAIILANYCGQFGSDSRLQGGVHFSGLHDAIANMKFEYSAKTWQTYLAYSLKKKFFTPRAIREATARGVNVKKVFSRHVANIVDVDTEFVAVFNKYNGVRDYYRDLSLAAEDKWKGVAVPLLAVAARDDPITHCDALGAIELSAGNGNLLFLITDRGGHVGWPWGLKPWQHGFAFMSEVIGVFISAILVDA